MSCFEHVNGPAHIWSGTGVANALEEVGISTDGVEIDFNTYWDDVFTDMYGPKMPYDRQQFLLGATIKATLIWYDLTVVEKWLTSNPTNPQTLGTVGAAGLLAVQNGLAARLVVRSTPSGTGLTSVEPCWSFNNCILVDSSPMKVGTKITTWQMTWQALLTQNTTSAAGAVLYTNACN